MEQHKESQEHLAAPSGPVPSALTVDADEVQRVLGYLRSDEAEIRAERRNFTWADTMARASDLIRNLAASPAAAAPELLEALRELRENAEFVKFVVMKPQIYVGNDVMTARYLAALSKADAAIAKCDQSASSPLSAKDQALIEKGWAKYGAAAPRCTKAPAGWHCTRVAGHDGPCAAERLAEAA